MDKNENEIGGFISISDMNPLIMDDEEFVFA